MPFWPLLLRRDVRCRENPQELVGFFHHRLHFIKSRLLTADEHFQPKKGLISFFFNNSYLAYKLSLRTSATCRSIVCCDRSSRANELPAENVCRCIPLEPLHKTYNIDSEILRPRFKLGRIHCFHPSIVNRKSEIENITRFAPCPRFSPSTEMHRARNRQRWIQTSVARPSSVHRTSPVCRRRRR